MQDPQLTCVVIVFIEYVHYNVHIKIPLGEMKTIKNVLYVFDF
jgi:hypothetical protein